MEQSLVVVEKHANVGNAVANHRRPINTEAESETTVDRRVDAAGLQHPGQLRPFHIFRRSSANASETLAETYSWLSEGQLLDEGVTGDWHDQWQQADVDSFAPRSM